MVPKIPFSIAILLKSFVLVSMKELSSISNMYLNASIPTSFIELLSSYILHNKLNKISKHFLCLINELKKVGR